MCSLAWWGDLGMIWPLMGTGTWKPIGTWTTCWKGGFVPKSKNQGFRGPICGIRVSVFVVTSFVQRSLRWYHFVGSLGVCSWRTSNGASLDLGASDHQLGVAPLLGCQCPPRSLHFQQRIHADPSFTTITEGATPKSSDLCNFCMLRLTCAICRQKVMWNAN